MSYTGNRENRLHDWFGVPDEFDSHYLWLKSVLESSIKQLHRNMLELRGRHTTLTTRTGIRDCIIALDKIQDIVRNHELKYLTTPNELNDINAILTRVDTLLDQAKLMYNTILNSHYQYRWVIDEPTQSATARRILEPGYNNEQRKERNLRYKKNVGWYPPVTLLSSLPEVSIP